MRRASRTRGGQARLESAGREERHSTVVPRGQGSAEPTDSPDWDEITVVEREEWIRARDQIALIVRTTVAEAMLPLQESIGSLAARLEALTSQPADVPPPPTLRETMLPPPLPHEPPTQLAAILMDRVAAVLDERVAEELAKTSLLREPESSPDDDPSS